MIHEAEVSASTKNLLGLSHEESAFWQDSLKDSFVYQSGKKGKDMSGTVVEG